MAEVAMATAAGSWSGAELLAYGSAAAEWFDDLGIPVGSSVPALVTTFLAAGALLIGGTWSERPLAINLVLFRAEFDRLRGLAMNAVGQRTPVRASTLLCCSDGVEPSPLPAR